MKWCQVVNFARRENKKLEKKIFWNGFSSLE